MNLPRKFILAFPVVANRFLHYKSYWVDLEAKSIVVTVNKHNRNYGGLSTYLHHEGGIVDVLKARMFGKLPFPYDRRFITNGVTDNVLFRVSDRAYASDEHGKFPIRFLPVRCSFSSWSITHGDVPNEHLMWDKENMLNDAIYKLCEDRMQWYDCRSFVNFEKNERSIVKMLRELFYLMSHSQVLMTCDMYHYREKRKPAKNLHSLYDRHVARFTDPIIFNLLEKVFPPRPSHLKTISASITRKCVERFIRRHPTKATSALLKLIAAFGFGKIDNVAKLA